MPICPKCKKIINYLEEVRTGYERSKMFVNEDKSIWWEDEEFSGDDNVLEFYCPECNEELDFTEEEAHNFLRNKDEVAEMVAEKINQFSPDKLNQNKEKKDEHLPKV